MRTGRTVTAQFSTSDRPFPRWHNRPDGLTRKGDRPPTRGVPRSAQPHHAVASMTAKETRLCRPSSAMPSSSPNLSGRTRPTCCPMVTVPCGHRFRPHSFTVATTPFWSIRRSPATRPTLWATGCRPATRTSPTSSPPTDTATIGSPRACSPSVRRPNRRHSRHYRPDAPQRGNA
jgi:hypothetical protein